MFKNIKNFLKNIKFNRETPFTREYIEGYNKNWIQALKEW
jgi:hypothetical protein